MQQQGEKPSGGLLSLSDELAIQRTRLANDRTLLSFIRTSLYFSIAGLTISNLLNFALDWLVVVVFYVIAMVMLILGVVRYFRFAGKLKSAGNSNAVFHALLHDEE